MSEIRTDKKAREAAIDEMVPDSKKTRNLLPKQNSKDTNRTGLSRRSRAERKAESENRVSDLCNKLTFG